jgi:UDP-N-acetylmuramate dehydrogenase
VSSGYALAWSAPLRARNTFRIEASARCFATVRDADALPALFADPALRGLPTLVLGEGSNVLFAAARHEGVIVHLACDAVAIVEEATDRATVRVDAAYEWDALVDWTLERGLHGLENLALIPGQVGAAPIQNIGAYGVEAGEFIVAVHAYDRPQQRMVRLTAADCAFDYRDSVFKRELERRIIVAVEFRLSRDTATRLDYAGIRDELQAMGIAATPCNVAAAVRRIRRRKLPDPAVVGNAGSFFKNPIVPRDVASALREQYATMPVYPAPAAGARKLSAAWLIEQAGWRGFREGDAGVSSQHALVIVNHGNATGAQVLAVARRVGESVQRKFGVSLEPEPRIVDATF